MGSRGSTRATARLIDAAQRTGGSAAPNSADRQRWGSVPAARTVPRIDWKQLLGVSCNDGMDSPRNVLGIGVPTLP